MQFNTKKKVLAIVGGGSIATSVVCQLVDEVNAAGGCDIACILLFDPCLIIGAGIAYQLDCVSNLLNTRADAMSPINSKPDHFIEWLKGNEKKWRSFFPQVTVTEDAFLPRGLFGLYLESIFQDSKQALHALGVTVQHVRSIVSGMAAINSGYVLQTCSESYFADNVVLGIGNLQSSDWIICFWSLDFLPLPTPVHLWCKILVVRSLFVFWELV